MDGYGWENVIYKVSDDSQINKWMIYFMGWEIVW